MLAISFSAKTDIDPATIVAAMPRAIASGHADADGKTLRFVLNQPVKLHVSQVGNRAVVDLATTDFTGAMPDLVAPSKPVAKPVDVASLPEIKLRTGAYEKFTRLVFDWPQGCFLSRVSRRRENDDQVRHAHARRCFGAWRVSRRPG